MTEETNANLAVEQGKDADSDPVEKEIEHLQAQLEEFERQAEDLRRKERHAAESVAIAAVTSADADNADERSIYVGNVDYSASPEEIQSHFQACGTINRVTILCDKFTGHPKGYAYVEFAEQTFVEAAVTLNESLFKGRLIKVTPKRTNIPGFIRGRGTRRPYRGGYRGGGFQYAPYRARGRGRGRGY